MYLWSNNVLSRKVVPFLREVELGGERTDLLHDIFDIVRETAIKTNSIADQYGDYSPRSRRELVYKVGTLIII